MISAHRKNKAIYKRMKRVGHGPTLFSNPSTYQMALVLMSF